MILRDDEILTGFSGRSRRRNIGEGRNGSSILSRILATHGAHGADPNAVGIPGWCVAVGCWMDGCERRSLAFFTFSFFLFFFKWNGIDRILEESEVKF